MSWTQVHHAWMAWKNAKTVCVGDLTESAVRTPRPRSDSFLCEPGGTAHTVRYRPITDGEGLTGSPARSPFTAQ